MAGFKHSCHASSDPKVTQYCDCMEQNLNAAIPAKAFNDPAADPEAVAQAFMAIATKIVPICKAQVAGSP